MKLLSFDEWFNEERQMDLRMPLACTLTFKNKLTIQEWQEFIEYVYTKCIESRPMKQPRQSIKPKQSGG